MGTGVRRLQSVFQLSDAGVGVLELPLPLCVRRRATLPDAASPRPVTGSALGLLSTALDFAGLAVCARETVLAWLPGAARLVAVAVAGPVMSSAHAFQRPIDDQGSLCVVRCEPSRREGKNKVIA